MFFGFRLLHFGRPGRARRIRQDPLGNAVDFLVLYNSGEIGPLDPKGGGPGGWEGGRRDDKDRSRGRERRRGQGAARRDPQGARRSGCACGRVTRRDYRARSGWQKRLDNTRLDKARARSSRRGMTNGHCCAPGANGHSLRTLRVTCGTRARIDMPVLLSLMRAVQCRAVQYSTVECSRAVVTATGAP